METTRELACKKILQDHNYRLTEGRIALLLFLQRSKSPLTATEILKQIPYKLDKVTLYRALHDFSKSKIITKINLQDGVNYYEFLHDNHHHHHIVCEKCGAIEDIEYCNQNTLEKDILKRLKKFATINSHSLEFFGLCLLCKEQKY